MTSDVEENQCFGKELNWQAHETKGLSLQRATVQNISYLCDGVRIHSQIVSIGSHIQCCIQQRAVSELTVNPL